jgi:hypothetical protein
VEGNTFLIALHIFSIERKEPFAGERRFPAGERETSTESREASMGAGERLALVWPGRGEGAADRTEGREGGKVDSGK